jgi:hypothetical protein
MTEGIIHDAMDWLEVVFDLNLYVAVRTKQAANGSQEIYTQRAKGHWRFDTGGSVTGGIWTRDPERPGNFGDASFTETVDGLAVPIVTDPPLNYLMRGEKWQTIDKP